MFGWLSDPIVVQWFYPEIKAVSAKFKFVFNGIWVKDLID